ncbi:hypothetical protein GRI97_03450 [Altererythrobacter xixiisoli]|uniref:Lipoprotein n=1 Tax=Croceibacterium xixiisoli TaxID=1476466 RepID=A0A6I4TUS6_9SPHN|nr:hypothetical protein [Croceibacterium xixiisoli]MXO98043.1 hypothetical protein [Croceibacterium xixiisoli]
MNRKYLALALAGACVSVSAVSAQAQERSAVRPDFAVVDREAVRVIVYRPRVTVGEQSTGGLFEPRADWNDQARQFLDAALVNSQQALGHSVIAPPEISGEQGRLLNQYQALFNSVADSVINYQFFVGNRLETKKRDNRNSQFDWSLGPGVRNLPGAEGADYALFLTTTDHYGSTGRKVLQVFAALGGVGVQSGVHAGYAGLVDLKTGDILWINADKQMGGDVRTPDGAARRMSQLLEDFPLASPAAAAN